MKKYLFILICLLFGSGFLTAQDTLTKKEWRKQQKSYLIPGRPWTFEVPLWIPGFAGSFAYGDIEIEGDEAYPENPIEPPPPPDFGEILSRVFTKNWYVKFFFVSRLAYEGKKFVVQIDAIGGTVGGSLNFNYNNKELVQANFQTINVRLYGGYKIVDVWSNNNKFRYELFVYGGARVHFQKIYSDLNGLINKLDISPKWVEPII